MIRAHPKRLINLGNKVLVNTTMVI